MSDAAEAVTSECSLSAAASGQREREWRALLARAGIGGTRIAGGLRVELRRFPDVGEELERLVTAERQCCPSMQMHIQTSAGAIALTVTASAAAAAIVEQLFAGAVR